MKKNFFLVPAFFSIRLLPIILLSLLSKQTSAQLTFIPDPAFSTFLQTNFPAAMAYPDSLDQNDSLVISTTSIDCSNALIYDLTGISAFVNLNSLDCSLNNLAFLPVLPDSIYSLDCSGNFITSISALPGALKILNCENCALNVLPALPPGLLELYCRYNFLSTLPTLPASLISLSCPNNQITTISSLPPTLSILDCSINQLSALPTLPATLTSLACSFNVQTSLPALPNGLLILACNSNPLLTLPAILPPLLQILDISGIQSTTLPAYPTSLLTLNCRAMIPKLTTIPALPPNLTKLDFRQNLVSTLPVLPSGLKQLYADNNNIMLLPQPLPSSLDEIKLVNNPITCIPWLPSGILFVDSDISDCLLNNPAGCINCSSYATCTPAYNCNNVSYVNGTIFNDLNTDGIFNNSEPGRPNCFIYSNNGNFSSGSDTNGIYYLPSDTGINFIVQTQIPPYRILSTIPTNHFFSNYGLVDSLNNIGFYDLSNINDLAVSLYSYGSIKPDFNYHSLILLDNPGTTIQSGQIYFLKPSLAVFVSALPIQSFISGDTIFWNFSNMVPLTTTVKYNVELYIPSSTLLGTIMTGYAGIFSAAIDTTPGNNFSSESITVLSSYDPNDKSAEPENEFTTAQMANGEYMTYTIRFQNTGTASANQVVIVDTISADFDLVTFMIISSSHIYNWKIENHILYVRFDNINLPDSSSNESLSHGFFKYKVKPMISLPIGEVMNNTAYIYFDFNIPVQTNTTNTVIVTPLSVPDDYLQNDDFRLFPNPSNGLLYLHFAKQNLNIFSEFEILDLTGRTVMQGNIFSTYQKIDIHSIHQGMYIFKMTCNGQLFQQKFVCK